MYKLRLYLFRHGETGLNRAKVYQGILDPPLCEDGRLALFQKAEEARKVLPLSAVFVSPMIRARETAEIFFPEFQHLVIPELRERNFGPYEGLPWAKLEKDPEYRLFVDSEGQKVPEGMERFEDFNARLELALEKVCRSFQPAEIEADTLRRAALVFHGGSIMQLTRFVFDCGCQDLFQYRLENGECLCVEGEVEGGHFQFRRLLP